MNKITIFVILIAVLSVVYASEFTKKPTRRNNAQQEAVYESCLESVDRIIELSCKVQSAVAQLMGSCYKTLRSCAFEEKPALSQVEIQKLKGVLSTLQLLEKQLAELEITIKSDALLPLKTA